MWKIAKLVLIPKAGSGATLSYRPICLLDEIGKALERLIAYRIKDCIREDRMLSSSQYGFREGLSTSKLCSKLSVKLRRRYSARP